MTSQAWVRTKTRHGDTLGSLAARYDVAPQEILRANSVVPKEDHTQVYVAKRAKELKLPPVLPTPVAQKLIEQDDVSVWVNDVDGNAVEITPGSPADISRFASCPTGKYAMFSADSVIYLPECVADAASLPLVSVAPKRLALPALKPGMPVAIPGAPLSTATTSTGPLSSLSRLPRGRYLGSYEIGAVVAGARDYDTTVQGDVMEIQAELNDAWNCKPALAVDGVYGNLTRSAVTAFQAANNLSANGTVDHATSMKIQDDAANEIPAGALNANGTLNTLHPVNAGAASSSNDTFLLVGGLGLLALSVGAFVVISKRGKKTKRRGKRNPRRRRRLAA